MSHLKEIALIESSHFRIPGHAWFQNHWFCNIVPDDFGAFQKVLVLHMGKYIIPEVTGFSMMNWIHKQTLFGYRSKTLWIPNCSGTQKYMDPHSFWTVFKKCMDSKTKVFWIPFRNIMDSQWFRNAKVHGFLWLFNGFQKVHEFKNKRFWIPFRKHHGFPMVPERKSAWIPKAFE